MHNRVYQTAQYQCPHCSGIIHAPAESIEGADLAVNRIFVGHDCPKLEKTIPVRFTITGLREVINGEEGEVIGHVSNTLRSVTVPELRPRQKKKCPD